MLESKQISAMTPREKSKGILWDKNELVSSYLLRKYTKTKKQAVLEFRFDSLFEKIFPINLDKDAHFAALRSDHS